MNKPAAYGGYVRSRLLPMIVAPADSKPSILIESLAVLVDRRFTVQFTIPGIKERAKGRDVTDTAFAVGVQVLQ